MKGKKSKTPSRKRARSASSTSRSLKTSKKRNSVAGGWFEERKLAKAVKRGDKEKIEKFGKILLEKKKSIDKNVFKSSMPWSGRGKQNNLDVAIKKKDKEVVKSLVAMGASVDPKKLTSAVKAGDLEMIKTLLEKIEPTQESLLLAIEKGDMDMVALLFDRNREFKKNQVFIFEAIEAVSNAQRDHQSRDARMKILKHIVQETEVDLKKIRCSRCMMASDEDLIKYLLSEVKTFIGNIDICHTPLSLYEPEEAPLTKYLSFETIKKFIDYWVKEEPQKHHPKGEVMDDRSIFLSDLLIIHIADPLLNNSEYKNLDLKLDAKAKRVFDYVKSLHITFDDRTDERLIYGISYWSPQMLDAVLDVGVNPNTIPNYPEGTMGDSIFAYYVENNKMDLVKVMIKHGVDVNYCLHKDLNSREHTWDPDFDYHYTPLMIAVYKNNYDMVKILLENGADPHLTTTHIFFHPDKKRSSVDFPAKDVTQYVDGLGYALTKRTLSVLDIAKAHKASPKIVALLEKALQS